MATKTVLVVDDETLLADLYTRYLEDDYTVLTAYDGLDAMDMMNDSVDLVTLDLRMAGVTGVHVLRWLREEGYDTPVVVVSALDPEEAELPIDPQAYLKKPVGHEELLAAVKRFLA